MQATPQTTQTAPRVLVVDDEPSICWGFERLLTSEGFSVVTASSAEHGLQIAQEQAIDLVLLDVRLPGQDGLTALPQFRRVTNQAPVVVMTAFGDLETAVQAVRQGATDYVTKPFKLDEVAHTCRETMRLSRLQCSPATVVRQSDFAPAALVGTSPGMQRVFKQIALVAESDLSVLITGETGTGKELVAAAIHANSSRSQAPYLAVAPVALNDSLVESELFGHVQGAFTGATHDRDGMFALAEGGTLFLDEIGELPLGLQAKLLRVLEQRQYSRVGDVRPITCDVRIIAATHCDLHSAVREHAFREDLLYRLSVVEIQLPPLRERTEDIPALCDYFLRQLGKSPAERLIEPELMAALQSRPWWGNIRELRNALHSASVMARGRPLSLCDFPQTQASRTAPSGNSILPNPTSIEQWLTSQLEVPESGQVGSSNLLDSFHQELEPVLLRAVLKRTGGNRAAAADLLGIHRGTLRDRLRRYGLENSSPTGS